jgi:flagellar biosynthesis/type III secretory pathway protein FliH
MSRRFIPPTVDALREGPRYEAACERAQAREEGFADGLRVGRQEGYAAGLRQGEEQANATYRAELDRLRAAYAQQHAIDVVLTALQQLHAARDEARLELEAAARAVIASALGVIFPALVAQAAGQEIIALIDDLLRDRGVESLTVRGHPDTIAPIRAQGLTDSGRLTLLADNAMTPGAAIATWSDGGFSFEPDALLEQVAAILSPDHQPTKAIDA